MINLYRESLILYVDNFAYIKAKKILENEYSINIGNALLLVSSNQRESPNYYAKSFLNNAISGVDFFNHIAKLLTDNHPLLVMKPDKPVEIDTFFRYYLMLYLFFRQHIPPDCPFLISKEERIFNWRKVRSVPNSFCGHKLLYFFFKELNPYFDWLSRYINPGNITPPKIIFRKEFEKYFSSLRCFPFIDTSFPSGQNYALFVKKVLPTPTLRIFSAEEASRGMLLRMNF